MSEESKRVAALFVRCDGPYFGRDDVDPWDAERDALKYKGPWPVVAHPPCARWGYQWFADGSGEPGNDGGIFSFALAAVRSHGGVIEHPAASFAFKRFDLGIPRRGSWQRNIWGDWITEIDQSAYGHRARKRTWLLAHGSRAPDPVIWDETPFEAYVCKPRAARKDPGLDVEIIEMRERELTPARMAEELIRIAKEMR